MKNRHTALLLSALIASAWSASPAWAQLPGGVRVGAQGSVQQRTQAQVQQRVQAQVQQRVQVEAARAARIAQQAASIATRQAAAARQRTASSANVRVAANARARSRVNAGNQSAEANAHANAYARLGIQPGLALPPGLTDADVKIYDNIFGRFNPLRRQAPESAADQSDSPRNGSADSNSSARQGGPTLAVWNDTDLATRITVATRHRRAEISQIRDRALATGNAQLLVQAQKTEEAMNAFVAAQTRAEAEARGQGAAGGRANVARRPEASVGGNARVQGNAGVRR